MSTPRAPQRPEPSPLASPSPYVGAGPLPELAGSGPGEFLTRSLTLRRPARLVADGLVVLALGALFYIGWTLLDQSHAQAAFEPTALQRNLGVLLSSGFVACWYLGVTFIALSSIRQLADTRAGRAAPSNRAGD
ncbi:MAG: hypothetical protein K2X91_07060 [Thermoleophilia bacterium]|nr:hypothetical protein [Thermoleophilia bacterium]